jgi:hypothetical protein
MVVRMVMRGTVAEAIEWPTRQFADPAHRLRFLCPRSAERIALRVFVTALTVAAGLAPAVWLWMLSRHLTVASASTRASARGVPRLAAPSELTSGDGPRIGKVWIVQSTPQYDLYSNGLRVEAQYVIATRPRHYAGLARGVRPSPSPDGAVEWRSDPAGIVYHTTESHLTPFEESRNQSLRQDGEGLLEYVRRHRAYHFVIDRFGRVFRIVRESDSAYHAGNSIWADQNWIYINLNQSFFGVAFEARSEPNGLAGALNAAQIYSGRILTDMLRARYGIAARGHVAGPPGRDRADAPGRRRP